MKKVDLIYTGHILDAIKKIEKYCKKTTRNEFLKNDILKDAVVRNLEIVGEAAKRLSEEFRNRHAFIAWKDICGMRDKIVHDYIGIDYRIVWAVIQTDLKELKTELKKLTKLSQ